MLLNAKTFTSAIMALRRCRTFEHVAIKASGVAISFIVTVRPKDFPTFPDGLGQGLQDLLGILPSYAGVGDADAIFQTGLSFFGYLLCSCRKVSI